MNDNSTGEKDVIAILSLPGERGLKRKWKGQGGKQAVEVKKGL